MTVLWRLETRESLQPGSATVSLGQPAWHAGIPPSAKGCRGTRPASRPHPLLTMLDTAVAEMGQWGSPYIFFTVPSRPSWGRAVRVTAGQPGPPHVQRGRCRGPGSRGTLAASRLGAPCPWLCGQLARTPPLDCPLCSDSHSGHRALWPSRHSRPAHVEALAGAQGLQPAHLVIHEIKPSLCFPATGPRKSEKEQGLWLQIPATCAGEMMLPLCPQFTCWWVAAPGALCPRRGGGGSVDVRPSFSPTSQLAGCRGGSPAPLLFLTS